MTELCCVALPLCCVVVAQHLLKWLFCICNVDLMSLYTLSISTVYSVGCDSVECQLYEHHLTSSSVQPPHYPATRGEWREREAERNQTGQINETLHIIQTTNVSTSAWMGVSDAPDLVCMCLTSALLANRTSPPSYSNRHFFTLHEF